MKTIYLIICLTMAFLIIRCKNPYETNMYGNPEESYHIDIKKFPADTVALPARLENMRPGQVRYAAEHDAPCLIPVGNMQSSFADQIIGWGGAIMDSLNALGLSSKAVIAPPVWYTPSGYLLNNAKNGTFDISMDAFTLYLEEVMTNIINLGFKHVQIVVLNNPHGKNSPLNACARFVVANQYNNLWKRPEFGKCWYINPKFDDETGEHGNTDKRGVVFAMYSVLNIYGNSSVEKKESPSSSKPGRLENMTPAQVKDVVKRNLICFVPSGVTETHGNQNPLGCDAIEAEGPLLLACAQADAVIAPTIWYGPTGVTCGDETVGNINIDGNIYRNYMSGVINGLAAIGFKKIVIMQVHQGPNGTQWVATDYAVQDYSVRFFNASSNIKKKEPADVTVMGPPFGQYDHAGKNETSWMMYLRPDNTNLSMITPGDYFYCWQKDDESNKASLEWGKTMCDKTVNGLIDMINQHNLKQLR
jgi:creatinine amidohydrolase/Fe(II)-dependent formamide hydrolase-like protein